MKGDDLLSLITAVSQEGLTNFSEWERIDPPQ